MTLASRLGLAFAGVLASSGCGGSQPSGTASFATMGGVIACAESVVWGRVAAAEPSGDRLRVTVDVDEWLVPLVGRGRTLEFDADDPAREVGAPAWEPAGRVLVVVPGRDPASAYAPAVGEDAVRQWREEGSRVLDSRKCGPD